ncbi:hypothetical protein C4553_01780 [Candidatus Parcubacteria bacterium]|nr:MAG: hypothetical protein C4553_01780 [Candidatus Parcubacteria bacterium]
MEEKLFLLKKKHKHELAAVPGGDHPTFDSDEFVVGTSPEEVIDRIFNEEKAKRDEWERKMETAETQDVVDDPIGTFPPVLPVRKEEWKAEEVKVDGYTIILEKQPEPSPAT